MSKVKMYLVWSNYDPNDSFYVRVEEGQDPALAALNEVGWCLSNDSIDEDDFNKEIEEDA